MEHFAREAAVSLTSDARCAHQDALSAPNKPTLAMLEVCHNSDPLTVYTQAEIRGNAGGLNKNVKTHNGLVNALRTSAATQHNSKLRKIVFGDVGPSPLVQPAGLRVAYG